MSTSSPPHAASRSPFLTKFTSCRWIVAFMLCLLRMCQTALRQNIGMALVCMAERPHDNCEQSGLGNDTQATATSSTLPPHHSGSVNFSAAYSMATDNRSWSLLDDGNLTNCIQGVGNKEFIWDAGFEGVLLSSYYYGYLVTPLLSSYIERVTGAKSLVAASVGLGALFSLLTPQATRLHKYLLVVLRVLAGATNGMIDPPVQSLWAGWAPKSELAYLTAVEYTGVSLGGIFTFLISGLLCQVPLDNGWPFVFYFYGSMSVFWVLAWLFLIFNKPSEHPRISSEELKYITSETDMAGSKKPQIHPPWLKMFCSPAVWAIVIATSTFTWVYSWVLAYLPMYMQDLLLYHITQNALLSSLPFVGKFVSGLVCGYLADRLLRTRLSVSLNRKLFQIIGCLGCSVCTVIIGFLDADSRNLVVALLVMVLVFQNITTVAFRINVLDIAPRYAGFILGLANTFAVAFSLTAPLINSAVVVDKTREQWQIMFYVVAALSLTGGVVFALIGQAKLQDWATSSSPNDRESIPEPEDKTSEKRPETENVPEIDVQCSFLPNDDLRNKMETGSPRRERLGHKAATLAVQELDAVSQWSSSLSLTG